MWLGQSIDPRGQSHKANRTLNGLSRLLDEHRNRGRMKRRILLPIVGFALGNVLKVTDAFVSFIRYLPRLILVFIVIVPRITVPSLLGPAIVTRRTVDATTVLVSHVGAVD